MGGGALSASRGGYMSIHGNEFGAAGDNGSFYVQLGNATGSRFQLSGTSGIIINNEGGTNRVGFGNTTQMLALMNLQNTRSITAGDTILDFRFSNTTTTSRYGWRVDTSDNLNIDYFNGTSWSQVTQFTAGGLTLTAEATIGQTSFLSFSGRARIKSSADGILELFNAATTDFTRLNFGGTSSSFPALKRSSAVLQVRVADDSAYAALESLSLTATQKILSTGPTAGGIGYGTGAGGTVTQLTNKSTGVTLDKVTGEITMNNAALAADAIVSFTLTATNAIVASDHIFVSHVSGGTVGAYITTAVAAAGSATITVTNVSTGSLSEAIVLKYSVLRSATS